DTHKAAGSGGRRRRPGGRAALARAEAGGGPPEARSAAALLEEARGEHDGRRDLGSFIKRADHLTHDDVPVACEVVRGQVVRLSIDQAGCFLIQSLLERAQIPMQKQLVAEMHGHVVELLESQHGNHVLQKAQGSTEAPFRRVAPWAGSALAPPPTASRSDLVPGPGRGPSATP
ncbi:unnamed protein product, partial [Prorocentrum cordatum]